MSAIPPRFLPLPPPRSAAVVRCEPVELLDEDTWLMVIQLADDTVRYHCLRVVGDLYESVDWMQEVLFPGAVVTLQGGPADPGCFTPECLTHIDDLRLGTHWRYEVVAWGRRRKAPTGDATVRNWPIVELFATSEQAVASNN